MNSEVETLSAELRDELAANNRKLLRPPVDTRTVPARFHHLRAMAQSGLHCYAAFQDNRVLDSLSIRIGAGTHAITFEQDYTVWTGKVRNGKVWDAFKREHADRLILSQKEYDKASRIADAIRSHSEASALLLGPDLFREKTISWEQLGRARRSTPDAHDVDIVTELKTTKCSEPNRFQRDGLFRAYHAQLADQCNAIAYYHRRRPSKAVIVAVETAEPYAVSLLELTARALDRGDRMCREWLERLLVCEASQSWPPYCQSMVPFDVPDDDLELQFGDEADGDDDAG